MEVLSEDSQGLKIPPLNVQEPPKKKKQSRKKPEAKPSKPEFEAPEVVPDLNNDLDSDLVVYTYKLESELASAKKKLKSQRQKFRQLIHSLAKNMDAKGITANIVQDYLQTLGPRLADIETESNYEKFFTTHKYRILEDSTGQIVDQAVPKEGSSKKTASKSALKTSTASDKVSTNGDLLHTSDDGQQTSTKKPKKEAKEPKEPKEPKAQKTSGDTTTTEGKKKKTKKHKESDDNININMGEPDLEILEIPPPKAKPKKEDAVKQDDNRQKTTIPPMPQQQQPQQPAPAQMNNMLEGFQSLMQQVDPSALMNAYLMAGAGQIPGMSESDIALYMGKTFQDMMKMGGGHNAHNAMRGNEQGGNDMMNYYQRNFQ